MNAPIEGFVPVFVTHARESEQTILGGLMMAPQLFDIVGDIVQAGDFFTEENRRIFTAVSGLINSAKDCDVITVWEQLEKGVEIEHLNAMAQYVPSPANARKHAQIIRERSLSRKLMAASWDIQELAHDHAMAFEERLEQATSHLAKLLPDVATEDWIGLDKTVETMMTRISDRAEGRKDDVIPTGLTDLDEMLGGGLRPGQLIIIGARPSQGKSALAVTVGLNVAQGGLPVGMFSLEMPSEELTQRLTSMLSEIHLERIRRSERLNDRDWPRLTDAVDKLARLKFQISELGGPNINQVRSRARKLKRKHGLSLLIVDYLQLATGTNTKDSRNNQLGEFSRGLKSLAKELKIPVVALAQLGRDIEKRANPRPMLSDLKDCGDIEQDADVIMFVDRPIMSNATLGQTWECYADLIVGKQRNGPRGSVSLRYVGQNVQFLDWEGDKPSKHGGTPRGEL